MANTSNRGDQSSQAREHAEAAKSHLHQAGSEGRQAASAAASSVGQKTQEAASGLADRAKQGLAAATEKAKDVASTVGHKVEDKTDDALASMGQRMSSVAGSLRSAAPRSGMVGSAAGTVADGLESGGRYLQEHGVSEIMDDLGGVIRRNPFASLGVAFSVGLLLGMVSRR
jgi:ElaB/YqjD/DUF883 family membrane-anchored ribosome-binding protein